MRARQYRLHVLILKDSWIGRKEALRMTVWETFMGGAIFFVIYLVVSSIRGLFRPPASEGGRRNFIILDRE
jgi:hypothetical protein